MSKANVIKSDKKSSINLNLSDMYRIGTNWLKETFKMHLKSWELTNLNISNLSISTKAGNNCGKTRRFQQA
jgi:hypothetical protein